MRYRGGHLQIIASAGSGKTEVVSQRVADLLADGFPAESIVAFTFTERAADELTNRIVHRVEDRLGGAARKGAALLSGLVRCGRCGRMMQVGYSGHGGDTPRYVCGRGTQLYGTPPCQSIGGVHLHRAVLEQLFEVLQPASLEATAHAMADAGQRHRQQVAAFETALERARFEADRAMRKHDEVEPGNRLVARTLEARLEDRLAAMHRAEADLAAARARHPVRLTDDELAWLKRAGADVRAVFDAPATSNSQRKQLIRAVITEIVLTIDRQARTCDVLIAWQGTATTAASIPLPKIGGGAITTGEDTVALIKRLAEHYSDTTIAQILGRQHRRTATGLAWTRDRVSSLRRSNNIPHCPAPAANVSASGQDAVMASVPQTAQLLGVDKTTIYRWLRDGFITGEQPTPGAPWRIRIDQALRDRIQPDVPDGWLTLDQAAKALGVARQTVLHKVAYNTETALARALAGHYARASDEACALIREALTVSGDICPGDGELLIRLDPLTAPRRTQALAALCEQLTAVGARYPGTDLVLRYPVKSHPSPA